jgi:hypothetical protein
LRRADGTSGEIIAIHNPFCCSRLFDAVTQQCGASVLHGYVKFCVAIAH